MAQLLSNLPIGTKIKFGKHRVGSEDAEPIIWIIADKNHSGYPTNSVTLITEKIIDLRAYDSYFDYDEADDGEMEYTHSNIHKWLNSSASAGMWWTKTYFDDTLPTDSNTTRGTAYGDREGFLYNFTIAERNALLATTFKAQSGEYSVNLTTKVYLPSTWELINTGTISDGSTQFAYFKTNTAKSAVTQQVLTNTTSSSKPASLTEFWDYNSRNTYGLKMRGVTSTGVIGSWDMNNGSKGVRPVVNISANTKITDIVEGDGWYTILPQTAPTISGSNINLGEKKAGFTQTYTVNDADGDALAVKEYIDNTQIRSYVPTLNATNTISVKDATWLKLANGLHTIKIVATDGFDEVTRTYTFTKNVTGFEVVKKVPYDSATMPKEIRVNVTRNIPNNAVFKVYACNNGYASSPTWEEITPYVISGDIYTFTNTDLKGSAKWGVNIKVTVDRGSATGACYITEIGGNFE